MTESESESETDTESEERRRPAKPAEWATFGVAAAILVAVVAAILLQLQGPTAPPAPTVEVGAAQERDGRFFVPVVVVNRGDETAQNVQVLATLTLDDGEVESDQVIDFLAGGEEEELELVFDEDPAEGELEVVIGGYSLP